MLDKIGSVCVLCFIFYSIFSSLSTKKNTIAILTQWWTESTVLDPFKLDAIDFAEWKKCTDRPLAWVMTHAFLTSMHTGKGKITYVCSFKISNFAGKSTCRA